MYKCEECNLEFKTFQAKANHHRWQHLKYIYKNNDNKEKHAINCKKALVDRFGKWVEENVKCEKCENVVSIKYREGNKPEKIYCSRSCANKHTFSLERKKKISLALKKEPIIKKCPVCKSEYFGRHRKFCSNECKHEYRTKDYTSYQKYKLLCQFQFSLNDYPDKFDFSLVEQFGWYKPKNHGDNLNGVSRDHMFSIKEGFLQKISPEIISHPANCKLMRHNDNVSKLKKCSITFEELKEKINNWK
jgi:hypothetical protein